MDSRVYWIGFNLVKGIGAVRLQGLLDTFGNLEEAWKASPSTLRSAGLSQKIVEHLVKVRSEVDPERILGQMLAQGIEVLTWESDNYPQRLKQIDQPPPVLYVRGSLLPEDEWAVAVIGTRRVTAYGRQITEELAAFLASNGITVVSGLARGVDSLAHATALRSGGRTIAVLGSGVDQIYPPENRRMAEQITQQGAVCSDYPVGTPPDSSNFPPRNRLISGLSIASVIVEAGQTSGALITATFAAEQGRDVFAVPGSIFAPQSKGTNRLLQQGARPLLAYEEILDTLNLQQVQEFRAARTVLPANEIEKSLLQVLSLEPLHVDEIRARVQLPIEQVSSTLTIMELKGMARQVGGMNYVAVHEPRSEYKV